MSSSTSFRLSRVLPESQLSETGKTADTGLQLTIDFAILSGLPVEIIAGAFGYDKNTLNSLQQNDDSLVMVTADAHPDAGLATVEALYGLLKDLRKDEGPFFPIEVADALDTPVDKAGPRLLQVQAALKRVFGLRDPIFGQPRFPSAKWPERAIIAPFYLDEKIDPVVLTTHRNPLLPGTALELSAYPNLPLVQRLPWP